MAEPRYPFDPDVEAAAKAINKALFSSDPAVLPRVLRAELTRMKDVARKRAREAIIGQIVAKGKHWAEGLLNGDDND